MYDYLLAILIDPDVFGLAESFGVDMDAYTDWVKASPPAPFTGSSYDQDLPRLPSSWPEALVRFESSDFVERTFGAAFRRAMVAAKRQEIHTFAEQVSTFEIQTYRDDV